MSVSEDVKKEEKGGAVSSDPEKEKALTNSSITNSEDQKLIKARIFVGNLPADLRTEKGEIYDKFRKYGRIIG
jgi:RNA recognition motif-containing protein